VQPTSDLTPAQRESAITQALASLPDGYTIDENGNVYDADGNATGQVVSLSTSPNVGAFPYQAPRAMRVMIVPGVRPRSPRRMVRFRGGRS
jgi:sugar lactone lactonase YvrE